MSATELSDGTAQQLRLLRAKGCRVEGPGPMTPGATTPTPDAAIPLPGAHVQIVCGHRMVDGFGATADEAVEDALRKLGGYDPEGHVIG